MSKQHPYPQHVLHKVAAEIRHSVPTLESWEARALAQMIITPYLVPQIIEVTELPDSDRGEHGFGSTGN